MLTNTNETTYEFKCLSTDAKPVNFVKNGSICLEMDTGKVFIFDEENSVWIEI